MATISEALEAAMQEHQAGRIGAADAVYRQILQIDPRHAEAMRLSGLVAHQRGEHQRAVDLLSRAIAIRATPLHHLNRAMAYASLERFDEAIESYGTALAGDPSLVDAHYGLGEVYGARGEWTAAAESYQRLLAIAPNHGLALNNLGAVFAVQGDVSEALKCYRAAVRAIPETALAHRNLGGLLHACGDLAGALIHCRRAVQLDPADGKAQVNLGELYRTRGEPAAAITCYGAAVSALPDFAPAHHILSGLLLDAGDLAGALVHARSAVELDAGQAEYHFRLGVLLDQQSDPEADADAAARSYEQAVALNPGYAQAHSNLGLACLNKGDPLAARANFDRAIAANPEHAKAHVGRAMVDLLLGDWARGWAEYEWLRKTREGALPQPEIDGPAWRGEPLNGAVVLLSDEQGLGDAIQFVRYAPLVHARGGRVLLRTRPALRRLLATVPAVDAVSTFDEPLPRFDWHCPLLSLPRAFGTTPRTVPATVPYLFAERDRVASWGGRLGAHGFKVGICWQGNPKRSGIGRSFSLRELRAVASLAGVRLISLQKIDGIEQRSEVPAGVTVERLTALDAGPDAFLDTAAVMENLDLIITCDTSIAHLAGALGRPTWVVLKRVPDWRWMLHRDDSPWYPTLRLFRQTSDGQWGDVFQSIRQSLAPLTH